MALRPWRERDAGILDREAVLVRDGEPRRRPDDPGTRRDGLDAGASARAHLPAGADLHPRGGNVRDPALHHRQDARALAPVSIRTPSRRTSRQTLATMCDR